MVKMALMSHQKLLSLQGTKQSYVGPPCLNCIVWPMPDLCMRLKSSGSKMADPSTRYNYDLYFWNSSILRHPNTMVVLVKYWPKIIGLLCSLNPWNLSQPHQIISIMYFDLCNLQSINDPHLLIGWCWMSLLKQKKAEYFRKIPTVVQTEKI